MAIAIFAVGTPLALNMMGVFRNENYVTPGSDIGSAGSENDNSGHDTPTDSSNPDSSSVAASEGEESSVHGISSERNGESGNTAGDREQGGESGLSEVHDDHGSDPAGSSNVDKEEQGPQLGGDFTGGSFVKDNMPSVTYLINGEYETFSYESSNYLAMGTYAGVDDNDGCIIIDRYSNKNSGTIVSRNADSGELVSYGKKAIYGNGAQPMPLSEEEIIEAAKQAALNTDLPLSGIENATAAIRLSGSKYYVTLTVAEGTVEVSIDSGGALLDFIVKKDVLIGLSDDRIASAREKMNAKLAELNDNDSNARFVLNSVHYEEWGSVIYAVFNVSCYRGQDTEGYDSYNYYCVV
ncbi:MAG: hypothetical protein IKZ81_05935 [Clostridia bacterium]|nr:hypothetical protein [Clostridia bacterium]